MDRHHGVRLATQADIERIVELGRLHHEAAMPGEFHPEAFAGFAGKVIERGVVFMTGMGMLGGVLHPAYSSPNYLMAVELWWSAHDGRGLSLLCAFEDWAAKNGADEVRMSAVAQHRGAAVGRLLTRRGYVAREVSFTKGL